MKHGFTNTPSRMVWTMALASRIKGGRGNSATNKPPRVTKVTKKLPKVTEKLPKDPKKLPKVKKVTESYESYESYAKNYKTVYNQAKKVIKFFL